MNVQAGEQLTYEYGGHLKTRGTFQTFPDDSIFSELTGSSAADLNLELRLFLQLGWYF